MANQIIGKVIAVSNVETIPSKTPGKQPMVKRKLFIDCTRHDPYTGEPGYENTPLLEFGGKALEKLETLIGQGLKKDDIVTIPFVVEGRKYTDNQGKQQVFTAVRPYDIELYRAGQTAQQAPATAAPAPTQAAPQPAPAPAQPQDDSLPF